MGDQEMILVKTTNLVAAAGVATPVWLPWLEHVSQFSATIIPILSVLWLLLQIWRFLWPKIEKAKKP